MVITSSAIMAKKQVCSLLREWSTIAPGSLGRSSRRGRAFSETARTFSWQSGHFAISTRQPHQYLSFSLQGPDSSKRFHSLSNNHGVNNPSWERYSSPRRICCSRGLSSAAGLEDTKDKQVMELKDVIPSAIRKRLDGNHALQWEERFSELLEFKKEHGHTVVPYKSSTASKGNLGYWVNKQRANFHILQKQQTIGDEDHLLVKRNIFEERIDRLNEIGFVWNVVETNWQEGFDRFLDFICDHKGDAMVPYSYPPDPVLSKWVVLQRQKYRKETLTDEKIQLLEKHGFIWSAHDESWGRKYEELCRYREEHGDTNVPYMSWGAICRKSLWRWCKKQRGLYRAWEDAGEPLDANGISHKMLTKERREALERIDFQWELQSRR
jgi:hypothetical protein